ncbi:universal stress protein [Arthrobacter sp. MYb211]|uniref:universal stress protein n=1 Tax=Arthrobacter sp. MYb211 TaxID=1848594 RepID=UPI0035BE14EA
MCRCASWRTLQRFTTRPTPCFKPNRKRSFDDRLVLRKRSRVGKLLMGSIAQRILIEADCPVLAVKS